MRVVIVALNSQYIHTALAGRGLLAAAQRDPGLAGCQLSLWEGHINEDWRSIAASLYREQGDVYAFSLYIWNAQIICQVAARLQQVLPLSMIIFGGPEVTFDASDWLAEYPWLDGVLAGEGEETFPALLRALLAQRQLQEITEIPGFVSRGNPGTPPQGVCDLNTIPFPYTDDELRAAPWRIYYYESTRGCSFTCQYCLSAAQLPVRYKDLDIVLADLNRFIAARVRKVKFVDRTFNLYPERSIEIWRFLMQAASMGAETSYHFELAGELLDDAALQVLRIAPPGLFQFEIGVQSTNPDTLSAIKRPSNLAVIQTRIRQLQSLRGQHLHLDLIAGLPKEGWRETINSFNWVADLRPDMLQLGFLKMLRGSGLRETATERGDLYSPLSPYEILRTPGLNHDQLLQLQRMAKLVDKYYNSGKFSHIMRGLLPYAGSWFQLFLELDHFWEEQGYPTHAREVIFYQRLALFALQQGMPPEETYCRLGLDFCLWHRDEDLPEPLDQAVQKEKRSQVIRQVREALEPEQLQELFPYPVGISGKELWRMLRVETFRYDPDSLLTGVPKEAAAGVVQLFTLQRDLFGNSRARRRSYSLTQRLLL